jgi:hypothetical protein
MHCSVQQGIIPTVPRIGHGTGPIRCEETQPEGLEGRDSSAQAEDDCTQRHPREQQAQRQRLCEFCSRVPRISRADYLHERSTERLHQWNEPVHQYTSKSVAKHMPNAMATARGHLERKPASQPHSASQSVSALKRLHAEQHVITKSSTLLDPTTGMRSQTLHMDYTGRYGEITDYLYVRDPIPANCVLGSLHQYSASHELEISADDSSTH